MFAVLPAFSARLFNVLNLFLGFFRSSALMSTTIWAISASCALEPMVLALRFISCTMKSSLRPTGWPDPSMEKHLVKMAAQADGLLRHGDFVGKDGGFGQQALFINLRVA